MKFLLRLFALTILTLGITLPLTGPMTGIETPSVEGTIVRVDRFADVFVWTNARMDGWTLRVLIPSLAK